ncbi:MAG: GGDEF domain-containing protein, partial [Proteobacteria bacterium]|nr:GGDEF domain-containing protein [Pseudomonadota bacterium]
KADKTGKILDNEFLRITMSFGISKFSKAAGINIATDWISQADSALYESKQNGRNRTTLFKGH